MAYGMIALSLGANLVGNLFQVGSERARKRKLRQQQLQALGPLEALLQQQNVGLSESEGYMTQAVTKRTLGDLANRGVLNSSITAPAVAQAVAPIQAQHDARRQSLLERIVASRQAIYANTQMPGYGDAFGQALGEGGETLALLGGQELEEGRSKSRMDEYLEMLGLGGGLGSRHSSGALGSGGIGGTR